MEQMQNTSLFQLNVDANVAMTLKSAASWARALGVLGIIFGVLFIAMGFLTMSVPTTEFGDYESYEETNKMARSIGMIMFIGVGILYILGSVFALTFGGKATNALRSNNSEALRSSFASLRNYFAYWAVLMILGLLLMVISIAGTAIAT